MSEANCYCGPGGNCYCGPGEGGGTRPSESELRLFYLERLGEKAYRNLLMERISSRLEKTTGKRLDKLADLAAEIVISARKSNVSEEKAREEFSARLEKIREEN